MPVLVIEQLEVIDVDHQQADRTLEVGRTLPLRREAQIETASIGETGKAVDRGEFLQVLVGGAQFALAGGELEGHFVEGGDERGEFRRPVLDLGAYVELAAADARGGARERSDRLDDQLLATEPSGEQGQNTEEQKLSVCDTDLTVDSTQDLPFVETDHHTCISPR